ncbi:helicase-related protein [Tomitella biformata]|uniref:helicase-related protein n=1 Tax=Tomitella biformata TaxID=630403 RepID=UPI000467D284|nr:helicase-related protein [Tomitella biformata]
MPQPNAANLPARLEDLESGVRAVGIAAEPVAVLAVVRHGSDAATVTYKTADGVLGERLLYRADETALAIESPQSRWGFTADAADFRLAAEALRIRMAGLHDPMLAVSSSDVRPLPHQIRAVYGELLPRTPLRFLLADDPGAGKTIMAGLYAKELMLRGDLTRMLIIAPGGLVEQWQDELDSKFGIRAELLSREMFTGAVDGNPFQRHPLLIARMDQLARNEELLEHLEHSEWDLVVVDEAHRMSASWWGGELRKTKRYELGQQLGRIARHLLLMTATPHSGSEENFQTFLALLDPDRFEGRFRAGAHSTDTTGLMRRMVKEELLTFEGRPLFPERIAETVPYTLSPGELDLYESVTQYVREEMNRADSLDGPRNRTVGFALTVLQRRLASSTHAILRSLERRRERLRANRVEMLNPTVAAPKALDWAKLDDPEELDAAEAEDLEEKVVDAATASRTVAELDVEIKLLGNLVELATRVRDAGEDRKWAELRSLLLDKNLLRDESGAPRKLIVFTEHKDTLYYLTDQIRNVLGREEAVVTIHGGTPREERRRIREAFTHDAGTQVLVATDAAGEGLNLQAAYLMVNYDLPWNPNRLEQRFGRIHRIGQEHVCRLWNLVAEGTREGQVFTRLLAKMEEQRRAYGGNLFDVLGDAFEDRPLRDLLMDAIRYGDDPARAAELEAVVDAEVAHGLEDLLAERALARESLDPHELARMRREMDEAHARRLQPHYIELFFREAFTRLGGRISPRERQRFEISNVPAALRNRQRPGAFQPLTTKYQRVTFEPSSVDSGAARAELLAPGHPLIDTVLDTTLENHRGTLEAGSMLFAPNDSSAQPRLIVALTGEITDGTGTAVSKQFAFVSLTPDGTATDSGPAPYLDTEPLPASAKSVAEEVMAQPWLAGGVEQLATSWSITHAQPAHLDEVRRRMLPMVEKTRAAVRQRLVSQVNYLDGEATRLREELDAGKGKKRGQSPDRLESRARELEQRLHQRVALLDAEAQLAAKPPTIAGAALVIPAGMLPLDSEFPPGSDLVPASELPLVPASFARDTAVTDRRAVDAALAAERALGREPEEMSHSNPGFDIRSTAADGSTIFIEVKGRIVGAADFFITYNEMLYGKNIAQNHRLVMVSVSPDGPEHDQLRYLVDPFRSIDMGGFPATTVQASWPKMWKAGGGPV